MENKITIKRIPRNEIVAPEPVQDCLICLDQAKRPTTCPKCQTASCNKCLQQHLLNTVEEPHCPNCRFGFSRPFLYEIFPRSFLIGPWADYRRALLWEREKAYLPEAQIAVEREKQARVLDDDRKKLEEDYYRLMSQTRVLGELINRNQQNARRMHNNEPPLEEQGQAAPEEQQKFVRKCPHTDCKGYLSTAWKCGLCDNYTCRDCYSTKGQERDAAHTCSPEALATAQLLAKDTKPCPKCGEFIQRSEGCSNMFCTSCKTAFNWNTMKIQTGGYIDNPHYFAWRRANGGMDAAPGAEPACGGLPDYEIADILTLYVKDQQDDYWNIQHTDEFNRARRIRDALGHIHGHMCPNLYNDHNEDNDTLTLRVNYLMSDIDQEDVMRSLLNRERRRERHRAIREVLDTFVAVMTDIFRRFRAAGIVAIRDAGVRDVNPTSNSRRRFWRDAPQVAAKMQKTWAAVWLNIVPEFEQIRAFSNDALADISRTLDIVVPQFDDKFFTKTKNFHKRGQAMPAELEGYELCKYRDHKQPANLPTNAAVYSAIRENPDGTVTNEKALKYKNGTIELYTGPRAEENPAARPEIPKCQGVNRWAGPCNGRQTHGTFCHHHRDQVVVVVSSSSETA